jgi:hypothetical protein
VAVTATIFGNWNALVDVFAANSALEPVTLESIWTLGALERADDVGAFRLERVTVHVCQPARLDAGVAALVDVLATGHLGPSCLGTDCDEDINVFDPICCISIGTETAIVRTIII